MSFAFGHLVGAWFAGKVFEKIKKTKLSRYTWGLLLLGGILPDADFLLDWTLDVHLHRTFSHSITLAIAMFILVYITTKYIFKQDQNATKYALAISAGIIVHVLLDLVGNSAGLQLLWPFSQHISLTSLNAPGNSTPLFSGSAQLLAHQLKNAVLDMFIGTAWIAYLWWKRRVEF